MYVCKYGAFARSGASGLISVFRLNLSVIQKLNLGFFSEQIRKERRLVIPVGRSSPKVLVVWLDQGLGLTAVVSPGSE